MMASNPTMFISEYVRGLAVPQVVADDQLRGRFVPVTGRRVSAGGEGPELRERILLRRAGVRDLSHFGEAGQEFRRPEQRRRRRPELITREEEIRRRLAEQHADRGSGRNRGAEPEPRTRGDDANPWGEEVVRLGMRHSIVGRDLAQGLPRYDILAWPRCGELLVEERPKRGGLGGEEIGECRDRSHTDRRTHRGTSVGVLIVRYRGGRMVLRDADDRIAADRLERIECVFHDQAARHLVPVDGGATLRCSTAVT
jgi:hypothetical protein